MLAGLYRSLVYFDGGTAMQVTEFNEFPSTAVEQFADTPVFIWKIFCFFIGLTVFLQLVQDQPLPMAPLSRRKLHLRGCDVLEMALIR
jgi:hypothetical protein